MMRNSRSRECDQVGGGLGAYKGERKTLLLQAGQSQSTQGHGDQPEHQGYSATDYSVAGAGTRLMVLSCIHWGGLSVLGTPPNDCSGIHHRRRILGTDWAPFLTSFDPRKLKKLPAPPRGPIAQREPPPYQEGPGRKSD